MLLRYFLRDKRLSACLNQIEASSRLGYANSKFLSNVELGKRLPSVKLLKIMCEVYKVSPDEMKNAYVKDAIDRAEAAAVRRWNELDV